MNKFSRTARSVTFAAIVGLSLGISAPAAVAQEMETSAVSVNKANIDFEQQGSITIFKRDLAGEKAIEGTGSTQESAPGKALGGVTFKVEKVDIDLSKVENWAEVANLDAAAAAKKGMDKSFQAQEKETAAEDGQVKFENLPVGIYLVTETKAPSGVIKGAPFVVSVPFTNAEGVEWNYNPVVYPKNTKAEAKKEVKDSNKQLGEDITYTLNTPTPALAEGQSVKKYIITDDFDQEKVTPKDSEIKLSIAEQDIPSDHYEVKNDGDKITITFKNFEMLTKNPSSVVKTTIPATVKASGEIKNGATVTFNNPNVEDDAEDIEIPTNEVFSYYGKVDVVKKDETEKDKVLQGAKFELYRSTDETCGNDDDVRIFEDKEFVTDEQGKLSIDGLHATNIEDHNKIINTNFCLKETEAPAGYVTPKDEKAWNSFKITVTQQKGEDGQTVIEGAKIENASLEITNHKDNTPKLPMTGGAGVGILAAIGAAIVAAGAWFARRGAKN